MDESNAQATPVGQSDHGRGSSGDREPECEPAAVADRGADRVADRAVTVERGRAVKRARARAFRDALRHRLRDRLRHRLRDRLRHTLRPTFHDCSARPYDGRFRRTLGGARDWTALAILVCVASACRAPLPEPRELLHAGFRSPEQAFDTFRMAVRADLAELEYRCWSSDFKERVGLGQMTYREVRDEMLAEQGMLGRAILTRAMWKAEVDPVDRLAPDRARIRARYMGRTMTFDLVREDFWEIWTEDSRASDGGEYAWEDLTLADEDGDGNRILWGRAPLASPELERAATELRIGREWKLDGFSIEEDGSDS